MTALSLTRACFRLGAPTLLVALAACSVPTKIVKIDSDPSPATVYLDGEERGETPMTLELIYDKGPHQRHFVQVRREGQKPTLDKWKYLEVPTDKRYTLEDE